MKLTYWIANCLDDSPAYSIRRRTRREVSAELAERGDGDYGEPHKITVKYDSAFDLLKRCLGEGAIDEAGPLDEQSTYHQEEN
jgi:hypothetical protein